MSTPDRDERLRRVERARQAGRLDVALGELEALVAQFPDDLSLANALGDLLVSHGQPGPALPHFLRVGDHFFREGFYSKATGVYRKILKFVPRDESMILRLAEALAAQGLTVEARAQFTAVESARRHRGDVRGAEDVALRMSDLEPNDLAARWSAARALAQRADAAAVGRYEDLASEFERQHRFDEAVAVWHEVIALTPSDVVRRERAARRAWARGDAVSARIFLGIDDLPPHGPALALHAEIEARVGSADSIRAAVGRWIDFDRTAYAAVVALSSQLAAGEPERAWACVSVPIERALAAGRATEAEHALRAFVATGVLHGPALVKWIEVAVLAHLDGVVDLVRERLRALPAPAESPVSAVAVLEAAARRIAPHGVWRALFEEFVGTVPVRPGEVDPPHARLVEPVRATVVTPMPDPAPAGDPDDAPPVAAPDPPIARRAAHAEFVEVDLTDKLNAIALPDVQGAVASAAPPAAEAQAATEPGSSLLSDAEASASLAQGQAFLAAGMHDAARDALSRALGASHTALQAALALADLYHEAGEPGEACRVLELVLPSATGRERGQVLAQLVVSLERVGQTAQALRRLTELAAVLPHHPIVRARRGREEPPGR
ncbi:MAG: hypothetical protein JNM38_12305 [Acidobacteria bacterium]|nr:hypothetical protein [Acidobacteriota bacterium]